MNFFGGASEQPYKFRGKEFIEMHGYDSYDFHARQMYPAIMRFTSPDPLAEKYYSISPYAYCLNNPMIYIDPDGRNPVFNQMGNLLGTTDNGLGGGAIIMSDNDFIQGMTFEDAMGFDLGIDGLYADAVDAFFNTFKGLQNRPDYDGYLTLAEANDWYRNGNGEPLFVDAAKIDLSPLVSAQLEPIGSIHYINFASLSNANFETGLVYGTLGITHLGTGKVTIGNSNNLIDNYGFEMQEGRGLRNIATKIGSTVAGEGASFNIYNYGTGKIKVK